MKGDTGLLFLNFTHPSQDARSASFRKRIRSHVTKKQHEDRRGSKRIKTRNGLSHFKQDPVPFDDRAVTLFGAPPEIEGVQKCSIALPANPYPEPEVPTMRYTCIALPDGEMRMKILNSNSPVEWQLCDTPKSIRLTAGSQSTRLALDIVEERCIPHPLEDPMDRLNVYCKRLGETMTSALNLLRQLIDIKGPEVEMIMEIPHGSTKKHLVPMVLSDYALLSATALWCMAMIQNLKGQRERSAALLELRGFALSCTQEAMEDPLRSTSDELLAAVSTLMNYEVVHGSRRIYHMHANGLVRMIYLRGGLHMLGRNGFMESMLLYHDANASKLADTKPFLRVFQRSTPVADSKRFLNGVSPRTDEPDDDLDFMKDGSALEED